MSEEKDKATRRVEGTPQSRLVVELTETRARLRALVDATRRALGELSEENTVYHGTQQALRGLIRDAEEFLAVAVVLIVPSLLLQ